MPPLLTVMEAALMAPDPVPPRSPGETCPPEPTVMDPPTLATTVRPPLEDRRLPVPLTSTLPPTETGVLELEPRRLTVPPVTVTLPPTAVPVTAELMLSDPPE